MKSFLVIGLGRFGTFLAQKLLELHNEVTVIDKDEAAVNDVVYKFHNAEIGDCTKETVIKSLGVRNFDKCFVTFGDNFQSSLEITSLLKEKGAKYVVARANRDMQEKFLLRNGADEVMYLERDTAHRVAMRHSLDHVFDYVELSATHSVVEMEIPPRWAGHSIIDLDVRRKHNLNILGIKRKGNTLTMPGPDVLFKKGDHVLVMGSDEDIKKFDTGK